MDSPTKLLSLLFFILLHCRRSSSSDLTTLIYKGCANQNFQDPFASQNLNSVYAALVSRSTTANFYRTTSGGSDQSMPAITGLYQCRGDLSTADCNSCVKKLPETIGKACGGETVAARVQLAGCYMRYEVAGFPQVPATELLFKQCGSGDVSGSGFDEKLTAALGQIGKGVAGGGKGFYAGEYQSVYVLGQCEGGLKNGECVKCVKSAAENARNECRSSISGHIYLQQCYIGYTYYPNGVPGAGGGGAGVEAVARGGDDGDTTQKTVAIVFGGLVGLGLGVAILLVLKSAFNKKKEHYSYGGY